MKLILSTHSNCQILKGEGFNAQSNIDPKKFEEALNNPDNEIINLEDTPEHIEAVAKRDRLDKQDNCMRDCHEAILAIVESDNATTRAALENHITELKGMR